MSFGSFYQNFLNIFEDNGFFRVDFRSQFDRLNSIKENIVNRGGIVVYKLNTNITKIVYGSGIWQRNRASENVVWNVDSLIPKGANSLEVFYYFYRVTDNYNVRRYKKCINLVF